MNFTLAVLFTFDDSEHKEYLHSTERGCPYAIIILEMFLATDILYIIPKNIHTRTLTK